MVSSSSNRHQSNTSEMELEDYLKEDYETFEEEPEQANEAPIYQNATMIETIRSKNTFTAVPKVPQEVIPKLMPAPSIANWRRERAENRYMNTSVNQNSSSSWSSANMTPTEVNYANTDEMCEARKRTLSNPRYLPISEPSTEQEQLLHGSQSDYYY